jgi:hypothetical protein
MGQFQSFVHGIMGAAQELIASLLCQPDQGQWLVIPWHFLFNNPTKEAMGWSFLQDSCTLWPVTGRTWLVDWLGAEPAMACVFMTQGAVCLNKL